MEVINSLHTFNSQDVFANIIDANITRCTLHEYLVALNKHVVRREHDDDGEQVRADGVDYFPFWPNIDNNSCNNDADRLQQVADEVHYRGFQIQVVEVAALRAIITCGIFLGMAVSMTVAMSMVVTVAVRRARCCLRMTIHMRMMVVLVLMLVRGIVIVIV